MNWMKKIVLNSVVITLIIFLCSNCAPTVELTSFATIPHKENPGELDIYTSAVGIKRPFQEVSLITVKDVWGKGEKVMLDMLIAKAKAIYADGLIILGSDSQFEGVIPISGIYVAFNSQVLKGTAIVYTNREEYRDSAPNSMTSSGTGFFVSDMGHIITCAHIVMGASSIEVLVQDSRYPASIIKLDQVNDLAVLKIERECESLPIGNSNNVVLGEETFTIGFPNIDVQGISPKLTKGSISSMNGMHDDPRMFQISVPLQPGNSGSPIMLKSGEVIGMVALTLDDISMLASSGQVPQSINYALKINYAKPLMATSGITLAYDSSEANLDLLTVIDKVQRAVVIVFCKK